MMFLQINYLEKNLEELFLLMLLRARIHISFNKMIYSLAMKTNIT